MLPLRQVIKLISEVVIAGYIKITSNPSRKRIKYEMQYQIQQLSSVSLKFIHVFIHSFYKLLTL